MALVRREQRRCAKKALLQNKTNSLSQNPKNGGWGRGWGDGRVRGMAIRLRAQKQQGVGL